LKPILVCAVAKSEIFRQLLQSVPIPLLIVFPHLH